MSPSPPATPGALPGRRPRVLLALTWLVATVLAAGIAWWAVTAVGGERRDDGAGLVSQAEVQRLLADQASEEAAGPGGVGGGGDGDGASAPTQPTASPEPSAVPGGEPGAEPGVDPGAEPGVDPGAGAGVEPGADPGADPGAQAGAEPGAGPGAPPATGDEASAPGPAPAPGEVARTWDVTGGQVSAVCTGSAIGLLYAAPADGWTVEVDHAGPDEVEVEFTRGEADARVRARCLAGTPEVTTEVDDGDDAVDEGDDGD